jgi:hypothetical protein
MGGNAGIGGIPLLSLADAIVGVDYAVVLKVFYRSRT